MTAFAKRLASVAVHLTGPEQAGCLLLVKQILTKYPSARSTLIELDDEGLSNAFTVSVYKPDINDPQLSNATQTSIVLELLTILSAHHGRIKYEPSQRLAKAILHGDALPQEFLGLTALEAVKRLNKEQLATK